MCTHCPFTYTTRPDWWSPRWTTLLLQQEEVLCKIHTQGCLTLMSLQGRGSKHFAAVILEPHLGQPCSTCCPDELTEAESQHLSSPQRMGVFKQYTPNNCAKAEAATLHMVWGCVLVGCPLGISLCSTGQSDQGECSEVQTVKPCETSHASVLHAHFSVPSLAQ